MTQNKTKRSWDAQEKLQIVKAHLLGGKSVSELCEEHGIAPSLYYKWQSALFDNGAQALERKNKRSNQQRQEIRQVAQLRTELEKAQSKLVEKHEVLSELMSEHIKLKKTVGD